MLSLGDEADVRAWLGSAIDGPKPADMRDFVVHLGRLSLHYWRPDFTPEQAKLMFQDFAHDMATVTALELVQACQDYRRDPENRFFPTPGKLLELVNVQQRARDRYAAQRLLATLDNAPEPERRGGPLPTVAEVLARHGRTMPETVEGVKPEPINTGREETPESLSELARGLSERMARA